MLLWTEKFKPLMAADGAPGAAAVEAAPVAAPAAVEVAPAATQSAEPAAVVDAPAKTDGAAPAAAVEAKPEVTPSLLEMAEGKPKKEAVAVEVKAPDPAAKETPAPADAAKTDEAKPADGEKPKAEEAKKDDAAKATDPAKDATAEVQPPAPVKYDAFKVPEGVKLDDKELAKFSEIIGAKQLPQEDAQKLVDLYVADMQRVQTELRQEQRTVWNKLNDGWKTDLRKDPVLGGNRLETTLSMAKAVIEEYGGNADQVRELLAHTSNNGMGNFPGFVRLLHNIGVAMNVFEDSIVPANPTAPKMPKSAGNRGWYDKSMGNGSTATP